MKIYDLEAESGLSLVGLALTPREAEELRNKLRSLLEDPQKPK